MKTRSIGLVLLATLACGDDDPGAPLDAGGADGTIDSGGAVDVVIADDSVPPRDASAIDAGGEIDAYIQPGCDCPTTDYCDYPDDMCGAGAEPACVMRPEVCIDVFAPVCGCDGKTHSNSCYAGAAGVDVDYEGECI